MTPASTPSPETSAASAAETSAGRRGRRGGGRAARQATRAQQGGASAAFITRKIPTFDPFDEEQLATIEANAETVLADIGIEFRDDPETLDIWRAAGAKIDGQRVRFEKGMLREIIQNSAPKQFTQYARNPARSVEIGGPHCVMVPAYGPPFIRSQAEGRRYATIEDFRNFVKLAYLSPGLHHSGGTLCEPVDLPVNKRHLDMVYSHIRYSDKPFMGSVTAPERAEDTVEICKRVFGADFVDQNCVVINLINANSPMVWDDTMLGALKVYARNNQATVISPFILAGAMSPVTVAGTLAQILAEAMSGVALTQLVRPGAPVVFGTFASSISMQSGAPTFGTPEPTLVLYGAAQLARRLGVPFRSGGGLCASKVPDAQAAYEAANTLQNAALAGVNFMLHAAGWLEGGLAMGYEKFVMDADQCAMIARLLEGPDLSENGQGLDALREVGPGAHFLGCAHTQANFEDAFYRSPLADNNSFEQWQADGAKDISARAAESVANLLASYEAPAIPVEVDEAVRDFVAQRKAATPDSNV
ncbi:MAG: trimethylamine methyltransferase family protein [Alphaproteobacteria bacterium]|nr:trimethylamine methyltransferase family protein [Alphaproteobacteria bacterium]